MNNSLTQPNLPTPLLLTDVRGRTAKASLRKTENCDLGRVVERTRILSGLNLQEFAAAIHKNESQVRRWITNVERQQLEAIYAVPSLQGYLVIALAEGVASVEVETTITVRRTA